MFSIDYLRMWCETRISILKKPVHGVGLIDYKPRQSKDD